MTKLSKSKKDTESINQSNIEKLLLLLNSAETRSTFWIVNEPNVHIMGIRPVVRTTMEIINENGFTPYENKIKENLFKVFKIYVSNKNEKVNIEQQIKLREEIQKNGIIYIKNHDLIYIYETIKESK